MANEEHLAILRQGVDAWNAWREANPEVYPDLEEANLHRAYLDGVNLASANLYRANLYGAVLEEANLVGVDLYEANLHWAGLRKANLYRANLQGVNLEGANLQEAIVGFINFAYTDLSRTKGLEAVIHQGPSFIDTTTLYNFRGNIPEAFLRACGVPDSWITYLPSLIGALEPIQFYSCFISYSTKDEDFAKRLHERMRAEHFRVWFAPEDLKGGQKLHEQIERAIQFHDRLLLVLFEQSIHSEWVATELYNARQVEVKEHRRKLFPIRLCYFETLRTWKCFDADTGKDLAREVREYFIPDFSNWKNHDAFEAAFAHLLRDLRNAEGKV